MLKFLVFSLFSLAACGEDRSVQIHLAVSDPSDWAVATSLPPPPRFTSCDGCLRVRYEQFGDPGMLEIEPRPILVIRRGDVASAVLKTQTGLLDPERKFFELIVILTGEFARSQGELVERFNNERVAELSGGKVIGVRHIGGNWRRNIPLGPFDSEEGATRIALVLGAEPAVVPYDPAADEENRRLYLEAVMASFENDPQPRDRIQREAPELFDFLEKHPKYWDLIEGEGS